MNATPLIDTPTPIRLTARDLEILTGAGAFAAYRGTELVDGVIVEMSPMGYRHARVNGDIYVRLRQALRNGWPLLEVTMGGPTITIGLHDAPQPDIVLGVRSANQGFARPQDIHLVMEVSDATVHHDLTTKRALYARAAVPEYWVVDIPGAQVHHFWSPADGTYRETRIVPLTGPLASVTIDGLAIDGTGIL